jgi:hypothetical protein
MRLYVSYRTTAAPGGGGGGAGGCAPHPHSRDLTKQGTTQHANFRLHFALALAGLATLCQKLA